MFCSPFIVKQSFQHQRLENDANKASCKSGSWFACCSSFFHMMPNRTSHPQGRVKLLPKQQRKLTCQPLSRHVNYPSLLAGYAWSLPALHKKLHNLTLAVADGNSRLKVPVPWLHNHCSLTLSRLSALAQSSCHPLSWQSACPSQWACWRAIHS